MQLCIRLCLSFPGFDTVGEADDVLLFRSSRLTTYILPCADVSFCWGCAKMASNAEMLKRCSRCKEALYCQTAHWHAGHKSVCNSPTVSICLSLSLSDAAWDRCGPVTDLECNQM